MGVKDKIKIGDLTLYEPIFTSNIQKSKCSVCQEFANIHCINCSDDDNNMSGYVLTIGNSIMYTN